MKYWLIKSEPVTYGIEHLKRDKKTPWTGVRNYQARNFMRDEMSVGDHVLFYHSNCDVPGMYGLAKVASKPHPDETQYDPQSDYFDPKATPEKPIWMLVDMVYVRTFKKPLSLTEIKTDRKLTTMRILMPGNRLSITPVSKQEYDRVLELVG